MTILIWIVNRRLRAAICFKTGIVSGGSLEAVVDLLMECPFAQVRKNGEAQPWIYQANCFSANKRVKYGIGVHGFKGSGFKVPFSSLDCIWDAYFPEKRQLRSSQNLQPNW
jgi:hypothetical protein